MNRRLLIQITAPPVLIGLLLFAVCLVSAWYVNRLQANLTSILAHNVTSMTAAQELETSVRQLRFHSFLYVIDPAPARLDDIHKDEQAFEEGLQQAEANATTAAEKAAVLAIREGYQRYQRELNNLRHEVERSGPLKDLRTLAEVHPARHVTDPCQEYARLNEEMMGQTSQESSRLSERLHLTMLLLGLGGPLGGLLSGYGIARGLSRSLYRLSVRVQDMAQKLEQDVAAVRLTPDGDLHALEGQLQRVVQRVAQVLEQLQRQQREMLRAQQLAAVGQLAASVAHDVRNPLTAIKMLVEAARRSQRPRPLTAENLQVIHGEILRLEQIVQGLLDFARPTALERRPADVRDIIHHAVELVRARARQQKVQIEVQVPDHPVTGEVDPGQLSTVLVNLLFNALDAMPRGGTVQVTLATGPGNGILLAVADTGAGIPAEMLEQLFTPFVSTKPTGSGLGLSICRRVVEEHGGCLTGENRTSGGACFTITLPVTASEASHAQGAAH
jgi:signal transduction histidine kinase